MMELSCENIKLFIFAKKFHRGKASLLASQMNSQNILYNLSQRKNAKFVTELFISWENPIYFIVIVAMFEKAQNTKVPLIKSKDFAKLETKPSQHLLVESQQ